jgi:hypothetical protein
MSIEAIERAAAAARLPGDLNGRLNAVADGYTTRGHDPLCRVPPLCDPAIDGAFEQFGYREGAEQAYLRVVDDNDAAVGLHRSIGYEVSRRYWYRRSGMEGR